MSPVKHVVHTSWCAHHYVRGLSLELLYFTTEIGPSNAGMAGCPHVVTQSQNYLLDLIRGNIKTKTKTKNILVEDNVVRVAWQDMQTQKCRITVEVISKIKKELSISRFSPERWYAIISPSFPQQHSTTNSMKPDHLLDQCSHGQRLHQS